MELDSSIYYVETTEEALNLIEIKKFNKNNDARDFINKDRNIIGGNIIVGVSVYHIEKHISWIKDMENTILLNGIEFNEKFLKSILNNRIEDLRNLREEIIKNFSKIEGFSLREIKPNVLDFPNFKNAGNFGELTNITNKEIEQEINNNEKCQIL